MPRLYEYESLSFEEIIELSLKETVLNVCFDFMTSQTHGGTAFYASSIESVREELIKEFEEHRNYFIFTESSSFRYYKEIIKNGVTEFYTQKDINEAKRDLKKLEKKEAFLEDTTRWVEQLKKVDIGSFEYKEYSKIYKRSELNVIVNDVTKIAKIYKHSQKIGLQLPRDKRINIDSVNIFKTLFYDNYARIIFDEMEFGWNQDTLSEDKFSTIDMILEEFYNKIHSIPNDHYLVSTVGDITTICKKPKIMIEGDADGFGVEQNNKVYYGFTNPGIYIGTNRKRPNEVIIEYSKTARITNDFKIVNKESIKEELEKIINDYNYNSIMFLKFPEPKEEFLTKTLPTYEENISRAKKILDFL